MLERDTRALGRGFDQGMRQQRAVLAKAVSILEKRSLTTLSHFRYAYLARSATGGGLTSADDMFAQPIGLTKLALFLVEVHRQNKKWVGQAKAKPLILLAERAATYLVVGVTCQEVAGSGKNSFGIAFRRAANVRGSRVRHDGFDRSVMEIEKDDAHDFLESLSLIMGK